VDLKNRQEVAIFPQALQIFDIRRDYGCSEFQFAL